MGAVAGAVALAGSLVCLPAHALSLGRITVQSSLGEPLRAEIEISDISPQEASTLNARLGTADAFKAAGLEFSQVLNGVEINLQRRPDGRSFLRLRGNRPIAEPFLDLLIQTNTANGSLSRDYAVLLDPPSTKPNTVAAAPTAPAAVAGPPTPAFRAATEMSRPVPAAAGNAPAAAAARAESPARPAAPPTAKNTPASLATSGDRQVTVKPGDTAGKLAAQSKPEGISLDQMLLAMQRRNPNAFIGGNVNRIKAGAVVNLPDAEAARLANPTEASQIIVAQSKDFNAFRQNLARSVPTAQVAGADRAAGGSVTARVDDRASASAAPDKLTLSKGAVQGKAGTASEDSIARSRQTSEASARVAELSKNISDLNKLGAGPATGAGGGTTAAPAPGVTLPVPSGALTPVKPPVAVSNTPAATASASATPTPTPAPVATTAATPPVAAAPSTPPTPSAAVPAAATTAVSTAAGSTAAGGQPASAAASGAVAAAPTAAAASAPTAAAPAPAPNEGFLASLLDNPLLRPLGAGLLVLLAGFGIYRYRRQHQNVSVDSSFLESRLQPDSFFGASGGQRIDTSEGGGTGSSMVYSPSQLDAAGDVDPVAEADVYLAYGRDLQAEEILKEALRTTPGRAAIYAKLCEIYAKRRDVKSFNAIAAKAHAITEGTGAEWGLIGGMGHELDAANPLYNDSAPVAGLAATPTATSHAASLATAAVATIAPKSVAHEIDFDLDLALDSDPASSKPTIPMPFVSSSLLTEPSPLTVTPPPDSQSYVVLPDLDMDFGSVPGKLNTGAASPSPHTSFVNTYTAAPVADTGSQASQVVTAAGGPNSGMLEFDLDLLSLDLGGQSGQDSAAGDRATAAGSSSSDSPLETKFSLAEEFRSLGDAEGARSLAQEVVAEAQGPLKAKAQAFINALA